MLCRDARKGDDPWPGRVQVSRRHRPNRELRLPHSGSAARARVITAALRGAGGGVAAVAAGAATQYPPELWELAGGRAEGRRG